VIPGDIIIPALTFRTADGDLDETTTTRYAEKAAGTWLDYFILSGTTTEGDTFTADERAQVLDLWGKTTDAARLVACCWTRADIDAAIERGIRPMAVMRGLRDEDEAIAFFRSLPPGAFAYSHPRHTPTVLSAPVTTAVSEAGFRPSGAKISKLPPGDLLAIRAAAGPEFVLWDGSCRNIQRSLDEGANGVVATPLTVLPDPFPDREIRALQTALTPLQSAFDHASQSKDLVPWLTQTARAALHAA
jgi:hypothetical protein